MYVIKCRVTDILTGVYVCDYMMSASYGAMLKMLLVGGGQPQRQQCQLTLHVFGV